MTNTTKIPFAFIRSALFSAGDNKQDQLVNYIVPAATDYRIDIRYTGPQLTTAHAMIWQCCVEASLSINGALGQCDFPLRTMLQALGRKCCDTNAKHWLTRHLEDLSNAHVQLKTPRQRFSGALLKSVERDEWGSVRISFDHDMPALLQDEIVEADMACKQGLLSHPLAAWLHDYILTHQTTYTVDFQRLHGLCGSNLPMSAFRKRTLKALDLLVERQGALVSYQVNGNDVTLTKKRTRVVLMPKDAKVGSVARSKRLSAIDQARMQRANVAL